jgi:hypothetical protein
MVSGSFSFSFADASHPQVRLSRKEKKLLVRSEIRNETNLITCLQVVIRL